MMFALRFKKSKEMVGFGYSANDGDLCVGVEFRLIESYDNIWVVTDRKVAELAAVTDTDWFNASYETPKNRFVGQLEVVELRIK